MIRCACSTLGYTQTDCDRVALAVDEACTNVIRHGYVERANGLLEVALGCDHHDVIIHVRDEAPTVSEPVASTPAPVEADDLSASDLPAAGGLGLILMRKVMSEVVFTTPASGGNLLELRKPLPHATSGDKPDMDQ